MFNSLLVKNLIKVMESDVVKNRYDLITFVSAVKNTDMADNSDIYENMMVYLKTCDYKPSQDEIEYVWTYETQSHFTRKTLQWFVYRNNKITYYDTLIKTYVDVFFNSQITDDELEKIYEEGFRHNYVCSLNNNNKIKWYEYDADKWRYTPSDGHQLCEKLKELIARVMQFVNNKDYDNKLSEDDKLTVIENMQKTYTKLCHVSYARKIISRLSNSTSSLRNDKFYENLYKKSNIIWFKNGAYYLNQGKFISNIRPTPDDNVDSICDYDYIEYDDSKIMESIKELYKGLFSDPECLEHITTTSKLWNI